MSDIQEKLPFVENEALSTSNQITCKVCGENFFPDDIQEHQKSLRHLEAQKKKYGEIECNICKEKFPRGCWKYHKQSKLHISRAEQSEGIGKTASLRRRLISDNDLYNVQSASEENKQYINILTTFLAVRCAFRSQVKDFKISVNDAEWKSFGDVVVEVSFFSGQREIEAIRCKKIESKKIFNHVVLSAESGKLSLREQCEIFEELKKQHKYYDYVNFKLYTVSSVMVDSETTLTFDEKVIASWKKKKNIELWKNREVVIKQSKSTKKDFFNTTDDADDVYLFSIKENEDLLKKFRMYVNQKTGEELKIAIKSMIEDKFNMSGDICEDLVKYVRKHFKTDKLVKKNESNFKMTKEDILLKITELLLVPHLILPAIVKEENFNLWSTTIQQFDLTVMKNDKSIVEKIYKAVSHILKEETQYSLDIFNTVTVDPNKIKHDKLRSKIFNYDKSLQFMYCALWKAGLAPLVMQTDSDKFLKSILNVVTFLKTETLSLKFIIVTNLKHNHSCFPEQLKVFLNLEDLKFCDEKIFKEVLDQKVEVLDFKVPLKDIVKCNDKFLENSTPEVLLNIVAKEFGYKDVFAPLTKDIVDNTIVLEDRYIEDVKDYFERQKVQRENCLSYLVTVEGRVTRINVPPQL